MKTIKRIISVSILAVLCLLSKAEDRSIYFSDQFDICMYKFDESIYLFQALDKNDRLGRNYFEIEFTKNELSDVLKQFKRLLVLYNEMEVNEQKYIHIVDEKFIISKLPSQFHLASINNRPNTIFYLNNDIIIEVIETLQTEEIKNN